MSGIFGGSSVRIDTVSGLAANGTYTLPAGYAVRRIYTRNNTVSAITGGVRIGTTDGGVDILAALTVGASALVDGAPLISAIQATSRTLYIQAVVAWNSASVDIAFELVKPF